MDRIYEKAMLYDFYGELLTEHQRSVYEDAVCNDMSLGELAEVYGISRQGVHDLLRRCDKLLKDYENRLHLVERFARAKETVSEIKRLAEGENPQAGAATSSDAGALEKASPDERLLRIGKLARDLMDEL